MKPVVIDWDKLNTILVEMEKERNEHLKNSAEYIEKDEVINTIAEVFRKCTVPENPEPDPLETLKRIGYDNNSITSVERWIAKEVYRLAIDDAKELK